MTRLRKLIVSSSLVLYLLLAAIPLQAGERVIIRVDDDSRAKVCQVSIDGRNVFAYQYADQWAIPHIHPLRSPSGKSLLLQRAEPPHKFPHHRSLWIADHVKLAGHEAVDFYHCWKNLKEPQRPRAEYQHFIRHRRFTEMKSDHQSARIDAELQWIMDGQIPVLDEKRTMKITPLGEGEYFIDYGWKLIAHHGDVQFVSDQVHYAWPYVRMHPQFSGAQGGTIINDRGETAQKSTDGKSAKWIDYSNKIDGVTEGLAVFVYPDGQQHKWLTREYGTFGPRRSEAYSGTKFTLRQGESLPGRVGILVHRGDETTGRVAQRYQLYIKDKL